MSFLAQNVLRTTSQFATRGAVRSSRLATRKSIASRGGVVNEQFPGGNCPMPTVSKGNSKLLTQVAFWGMAGTAFSIPFIAVKWANSSAKEE